jgi:hypothetical protein
MTDQRPDPLIGLDSRERLRFLAWLGHELTITARAVYRMAGADSSPGRALVTLQTHNELLHHVTSHLGHTASGTTAYPDDVFWAICWERAEKGGCSRTLEWAIQRAASLVGGEET